MASAIRQKRLSEDSTTTSETSDSERDRATDDSNKTNEDDDGDSHDSVENNDDASVTSLLSIPEIAGRYTDADPAFANDVEQLTPPILPDYNPRRIAPKHNNHYGNNSFRGPDRNRGHRFGGHGHHPYRHPAPNNQHHGRGWNDNNQYRQYQQRSRDPSSYSNAQQRDQTTHNYPPTRPGYNQATRPGQSQPYRRGQGQYHGGRSDHYGNQRNQQQYQRGQKRPFEDVDPEHNSDKRASKPHSPQHQATLSDSD